MKNQTLTSLKREHKKEIVAFHLNKLAKEKTNIDCIAYSHSNGIGFHAYTNYVYPNGVKSIEDVQTIVNAFPLGNVNFTLTFSCKDAIGTPSPLSLHVSQFGLKLRYEDNEGHEIAIELPENLPFIETYYIDGKHIGFGRYEREKRFRLTDNKLTVTRYSGANDVYTGTKEQFENLFKITL